MVTSPLVPSNVPKTLTCMAVPRAILSPLSETAPAVPLTVCPWNAMAAACNVSPLEIVILSELNVAAPVAVVLPAVVMPFAAVRVTALAVDASRDTPDALLSLMNT